MDISVTSVLETEHTSPCTPDMKETLKISHHQPPTYQKIDAPYPLKVYQPFNLFGEGWKDSLGNIHVRFFSFFFFFLAMLIRARVFTCYLQALICRNVKYDKQLKR